MSDKRENPLVSVLVPVYNGKKYLAECLDSIINQTYRNLQVVVVDDGSTDATPDILRSYADRDSRIQVISKVNSGVASARNDLLDAANGDFIQFVDADDWIEPDMIGTMVSIMTDYACDIAMCTTVSSAQSNAKENLTLWNQSEAIDKFLIHREMTGALWNKMIKRSLFDDIRFTPGISYGEDAMVVWDILQKVRLVCVTNKGLYNYRINTSSISAQGLTPAKMSVLTVWNHIIETASVKRWRDMARARMGVEITLLLYNGRKNIQIGHDSLSELCHILRSNIVLVLRCRSLSYKMKGMSVLCAYAKQLLCRI